MTIKCEYNDAEKTVIISLPTGLYFASRKEFRATYEGYLGKAKRFIIDFNKTERLDSAALGMLLVMRSEVGAENNAIVLRNARRYVKEVFVVMKFDTLFNVETI